MTRDILAWLKKIRASISNQGKVLEVGSFNVNGTPRFFFQAGAAEYIGVDVVPGPCVDVVHSSHQLMSRWQAGYFNTIICCEMLEHDSNPLLTIEQMRVLLAPGGYLIVTSPAQQFPEHHFPRDYWRLMPNVFEDIIFRNMEIIDRHVTSDPCHCWIGRKRTVRIIQGYHDREGEQHLDKQFEPYFVARCDRWFESRIICDLVAESKYSGSDYFGFLPWKFWHKVQRREYAAHVCGNYDYYVPKELVCDNIYENIWRQGRRVHGSNLTYVASAILKKFSLPPLERFLNGQLPGLQAYCNMQVCRSDLYRRFVNEFLRPAMEYVDHDVELSEIANKNSKYPGTLPKEKLLEICGQPHYTFHAFVGERLFPTWALSMRLAGKAI